jgi:Plavaka transposase
MAGIVGLGHNRQCTICLVEKKNLASYSDTWEMRDSETSMALLALTKGTHEKRAAKAQDKLDNLGYRHITVRMRLLYSSFNADATHAQNAFWDLPNSDPHQALSFDPMHNIPGGLMKSHLVKILSNKFESTRAEVRKMKTLVEKRCVALIFATLDF